jgi:hypothetical protein
MAKITDFTGYQGGKPPTIPRPDKPVDPMIVTGAAAWAAPR